MPDTSASVTVLEKPVTVLPPASTAVTTGCVGNCVPPVAPPPGCVVKTSAAVEPTETLKAELSTLSVPSLARSL